MACRKNNALLRPEESELFIRTADSEKGLWAADNSTGMAGFVRSGKKKAQAAALWPAGCHRGVQLYRGAGISPGWVGGTFQKLGQVPVGTAPCSEGQGAQPCSADQKQHWVYTGQETLGFVIPWEGGALNLSTTLRRISLRQKIVSENIKTGERKLIQD